MDFNAPAFLVFLTLFLVGYYALLGFRHCRLFFLLSGSLFFCATSGIRDGGLLLALLSFNFLVSHWITNARTQRRRMASLSLGIIVDAGTLLGFRYFQNYHNGDFPLGLSFYSFTSIAYLIEVYFQRMRQADLLTFAAGVSFFPTITAGPLVSPREFFRHLKEPIPALDWDVAAPALLRIANGLLKKNLADLSLIIGRYHPAMGAAHGRFAWIQAITTAARFYADFSGYSDVAIGIASLLGFKVPENFKQPYLSLSVSEFWRRWHITLGDWIRTYVYEPLLFSDFFEPKPFVPGIGVRRRHYLGLIISMSLFGIWHGLKINFLIWGLYHGILLCLDSWGENALERLNPWLRRSLTFFLVLNGFVIFTADGLPSIAKKFGSMYDLSVIASPWVGFWHLAAALLILVVPQALDYFLHRFSFFKNRLWVAWVLASLLLVLHYLSAGTTQVFIYSRF